MRSIILLALLAATLSTPVNASDPNIPSMMRNCLNGQEIGPPAPQPNRPDVKYFYITTVTLENYDGRIGFSAGWAVRNNAEAACDVALRDVAYDYSPGQGWSITAAVVKFVPDEILKAVLSH